MIISRLILVPLVAPHFWDIKMDIWHSYTTKNAGPRKKKLRYKISYRIILDIHVKISGMYLMTFPNIFLTLKTGRTLPKVFLRILAVAFASGAGEWKITYQNKDSKHGFKASPLLVKKLNAAHHGIGGDFLHTHTRSGVMILAESRSSSLILWSKAQSK